LVGTAKVGNPITWIIYQFILMGQYQKIPGLLEGVS